MPWLDLTAAALIVVLAVAGLARRRRGPAVIVVVGALALGVALVGLVREGARWQVLALAAVAVLTLALVIRRRRRPAERRAGRVVPAVIAVGAAVGLGFAAWVLPPAAVPRPTGDLPVGVASFTWVDPTRDVRGGPAGPPGRSLPVTIWYPATGGGRPAPLLGNDAAISVDGLAAQYGAPSWLLRELRVARGHAVPGVAALSGDFPVVLHSPGFGSSRWLAASWAAEVASHGAVVVAVDHPYDAAAVALADGSIARSDLAATGDDETDRRNAEQAMQVRAADLSAVLDAIARPGTAALTGADLDRVVATGHSAGGAAALLAGRLDPRIDGVVNVDGMPRSSAGGRSVPTVLLVAGDSDPLPAYDAALDGFVDRGALRVTVDRVAHLGFTDLAQVVAPVPGVFGSSARSGATRAATATRVVVDAVQRDEPVDPAALAAVGRLD